MNSRISLTFHPSDLGFGTVTCNGILVGSKVQHILYKSILHSNLVIILSKLLHIPVNILHNTVQCRVLATSRKEARLHTNIFISKWVSGDTATGTVMVKRKNNEFQLPHLPAAK